MKTYDFRAYAISDIMEMVKGYYDCKIILNSWQHENLPPTFFNYVAIRGISIATYSDDTHPEKCFSRIDYSSVEPKEDKPYKKPLILTPYSRTDILDNGKVKKYSIEKVERPCNMPDEPKRLQVTFIELTEKLPSQKLPNQDPFKLNPHEFDETKTPFSDRLDSIGYILKQIEKPYIPSIYSIEKFDLSNKGEKIIMRLPYSVNFVEKHKRTTLVWKNILGKFETTKSEAHDEKFDYLYGFLMAYFKRVHRDKSKTQLKKYLNAIVYPMTKKEQTAFLQGVFYENCGLGFKEAKEYLEKIKVKK